MSEAQERLSKIYKDKWPSYMMTEAMGVDNRERKKIREQTES